ncbi:MAG: sigma-54 dependent transcriptional regulator [bacterium]|nr:sigma-54 dependent transcriptional regulator [bacterium]
MDADDADDSVTAQHAGAILLVDDDVTVLETLRLCLQDSGYAVTTASGGAEAIRLCREGCFEVVVCDIRMPEVDGIAALRSIKEIHPGVRTIIITGYAADPRAPVEALRLGVDDYLLKPFDDQLLLHSVERNLEHYRLGAENARLQQDLTEANARLRRENTRLRVQAADRSAFRELVGSGPAMERVLGLLQAVLDSDIMVLLYGETGTGKEIVARALHYGGPRRDASFVPVHCGAIQETLLESELFGVIPHYPGLHSATGKKGLLQEADGDTRPIRVDVRVLAATNRDLTVEVEAGRFRQDLYYRLTGVEVRLPPLRERPEDIPLLARHFLEEVCARRGRLTPDVSPETLPMLGTHAWPGNVRELAKEIERAVTLTRDGQLGPGNFSERLQERLPAMPVETGMAVSLTKVEERHIIGVLDLVQGNIGRAAEILGIHRNTLSRKLAEYGQRVEE